MNVIPTPDFFWQKCSHVFMNFDVYPTVTLRIFLSVEPSPLAFPLTGAVASWARTWFVVVPWFQALRLQHYLSLRVKPGPWSHTDLSPPLTSGRRVTALQSLEAPGLVPGANILKVAAVSSPMPVSLAFPLLFRGDLPFPLSVSKLFLCDSLSRRQSPSTTYTCFCEGPRVI